MPILTKTDDLSAFCTRLSSEEFIAVDTEFIRESSYWPKLCLIQVAGESEAFAIDPLAEGMDLSPLFELMRNESILKVFHAARQDLEIFLHAMEEIPAPLFDTQVAAMVCGFGDQVSYEKLATKLAGATIDKTTRFADWAQRPLTDRQLNYALSDVVPLRKVYRKLNHRLTKSGRAPWLHEEMSILTNPQTYDSDPTKAWKRLKTRSRDQRYLAILRELATWREEEAQRRDVPRNRVIRDEQLFDIAAQAPQDEAGLSRIRGINRDFARGRLGSSILNCIEKAMALPEQELPNRPPRAERPETPSPVVELLKVLLKMKSEEHAVAQKLLGSMDDLERLARDPEAESPLTHGWRDEIFGQAAKALLNGNLALGAHKNEIVTLTPKDPLKAAAE